MNRVATLLLGILLFADCQGLELTLDHENLTSSSGATVCGLLVCEEKVRPDTRSLSTAGHTPTASNTTTSAITISSLFIFTTTTAAGGRDTFLTGVDTLQRRVAHSSADFTVEGNLTAQRATVRVELKQPGLCGASFKCQAQVMDAAGNKLVRTELLSQQPRSAVEDNNWQRQKISSPGEAQEIEDGAEAQAQLKTEASVEVTLKILALVEKLDTRLALVDKSITQWEQKLNRLEEKIGQDINYLRTDVNSRSERIHLEVGSLRSRLNDDIKDLDHCFRRRETVSGSEVDTDNVSGAKVNNDNACVTTPSRTDFINVNTSFNQLSQQIDNGLTIVNEKLTSFFIENERSVRSLVSRRAAQISVRSIEAAVTDLVSPRACWKGMIPAIPHTLNMYMTIYPRKGDVLTAPYLCDTVTDGGGWIILQRRSNGDTNFFRDWDTYKHGFGSLANDFWLGNDNIHNLTSSGSYELRVDLTTHGGISAFAVYSSFSIDDESGNYALHIGSYSGTAGDALRVHKGMPFSTHDRDNDKAGSKNCASLQSGAWWYNNCSQTNLNGKWRARNFKGLHWARLSTKQHPLSFSEMKIRRLE